VRGWPRGRSERVADLFVVATLLVMGLVEAFVAPPAISTRWQQALLAVAYAGVLAWRRRWPVLVLAVVIAIGPVLTEVNLQGGVISYVFAAILASYTVGRRLDPPATWWGPALTVGFTWSVFAAQRAGLSDFVFVALLYGGAWAVGYALRQREMRIFELSQESERLRRHQAEEAARAVAAERARIARELHDIVSHSISVITIQTQAVRRRLDPANERDIEDLRAVETTARQAMAEMRRLLGVLRAGAEHGLDLAPQPGLAQLPRLVSETVAAGVPVEMHVEGDAVPLPPGVDLAAYRVVQEALTNVRRHARPASALVVVRYTGDTVEVQVDDDGQARSGPSGQLGNGLAGMTERVTLYGGTLDVGPRAGGGYRVRAALPFREA
jgi:signal transduction histidine kinase